MSALAQTLQAYFTDRLLRQRQASPHTVAAYRDTLRLLLGFAADKLTIEPSKLGIKFQSQTSRLYRVESSLTWISNLPKLLPSNKP